MDKLDLTKKYKAYYTAKPYPEILTLPETTYLSIVGKGDPNTSVFTDKLEALYPVAYAIKFMTKSRGKDFTVPKLEGLWWYDSEEHSMSETPQKVSRSDWQWRLLVRMPEFVTKELMIQAIDTVVRKKKNELARTVECFTLKERQVVQMLHVGPFDREPETLLKMQQFMQERKLGKAGLHHEIYLSDFRKTAPEKLKTILREPVSVPQ